ncbi:MAG: ABC transporter permease [Nitrospinaceae bacterium]|jgi:peptide/nickel transport system permease protein|nr:ABC transporter permease [Nitrospinaceae bacterium]MBT3435937.1 ABC transporter permease [Nitrospinaceae bacterium]MBT3820998.1 ABC transporter permease [Nitrospinaceae bacterium]MBT4094763.1 ABC transporter permease [Nitrospinaceae bacterium]MBT4432050.1 ABC transporter permease [Nitrospinaceae bacterium]
MRAYIIRRILQSFIVFAAILIIVFSMLQITGNPAAILMPLESTQEEIAAFSKEMGFDQPLPIQFAKFIFGVDTIDRLLIGRIQNIKTPDVDIGNAERVKTLGVIRGDFGFSYRHEIPAMGLVLEHFPNTVLLAFTAVIIAILISIPAGVLSATFRNTWIDHTSSIGSMFGQSMPNFWLGLLLIMFFSVYLGWLPTSGFEAWYYIILPAVTAGLYATARITRLVRSQMLEVLEMDYVRTARSKGITEWIVIIRHALKNASIPVVTLVGLELGILLGGTVVTEAVFAWPGVGFLVVDAISNQDYPIVQAAVALLAFVFVFVNLVVDLLYAWLDPRISYS